METVIKKHNIIKITPKKIMYMGQQNIYEISALNKICTGFVL